MLLNVQFQDGRDFNFLKLYSQMFVRMDGLISEDIATEKYLPVIRGMAAKGHAPV